LAHCLFPHGGIRVFGDREQMGFKFSSPAPTVGLDDFGTIECDALEGIDSYEDNSAVSVDTMLSIAVADRVKHYTELDYNLVTEAGRWCT
jgi:hypothetical protein